MTRRRKLMGFVDSVLDRTWLRPNVVGMTVCINSPPVRPFWWTGGCHLRRPTSAVQEPGSLRRCFATAPIWVYLQFSELAPLHGRGALSTDLPGQAVWRRRQDDAAVRKSHHGTSRFVVPLVAPLACNIFRVFLDVLEVQDCWFCVSALFPLLVRSAMRASQLLTFMMAFASPDVSRRED